MAILKGLDDEKHVERGSVPSSQDILDRICRNASNKTCADCSGASECGRGGKRKGEEGRRREGGEGREGREGEGCGTIVSIPCPAPCRSCMGFGEPCHHAVHQLLRGAPLHGHSHLKGAFCGAGQEHLDRQPGQRESIAAFMAIRSTMCEVVVVSSVHLGCTVEQLHTVSTSLV